MFKDIDMELIIITFQYLILWSKIFSLFDNRLANFCLLIFACILFCFNFFVLYLPRFNGGWKWKNECDTALHV